MSCFLGHWTSLESLANPVLGEAQAGETRSIYRTNPLAQGASGKCAIYDCPSPGAPPLHHAGLLLPQRRGGADRATAGEEGEGGGGGGGGSQEDHRPALH